MNSRGALTSVCRIVGWAHCQTRRCQVLAKVPQVNFCSFAARNLLTSLHKSELHPLIYPQRQYLSKKAVNKKTNTSGDVSSLQEYIEVEEMTKKMEEAINNMKSDFIKTLSLRSAGTVESTKVKFEGKEYELQQIAKLTRKGQQTIVIDMLSFPQMTKTVADALKESSLNLNPQQDGTTIYVPIPKVTKEHRKSLAKTAKVLFLSCRDTIKNIREEYIKDLKGCNMGSAEKQVALKQIKVIADRFVDISEEIMKLKQNELLGKD